MCSYVCICVKPYTIPFIKSGHPFHLTNYVSRSLNPFCLQIERKSMFFYMDSKLIFYYFILYSIATNNIPQRFGKDSYFI